MVSTEGLDNGRRLGIDDLANGQIGLTYECDVTAEPSKTRKGLHELHVERGVGSGLELQDLAALSEYGCGWLRVDLLRIQGRHERPRDEDTDHAVLERGRRSDGEVQDRGV